MFLLYILFNIFLTSGCAQENYPAIEIPSTINYSYETIIDEIEIPWGIAFINENELLVTEKSGTLYHILNGKKTSIEGLPEIYIRGQGGLLDVAIHPDFKNNNLIYLTLASSLGDNPGGYT